MLYLNEKDIIHTGVDWNETIKVIRDTIMSFGTGDVVQPIKPYLRFKDLKNRIIAMPAYVGSCDIAGIKWIASFPDNVNYGIPRASSVVILNDTHTGQVKAIINGSILSAIRTASVSGLMAYLYVQSRELTHFSIGILGWGPIAQYHYQMCRHLFEDQIEKIYLFDIDSALLPLELTSDPKVRLCTRWEEVYRQADIFITCTVSKARYIDQKPRVGSLLLNVSLRDYKPSVYDDVKGAIVVDDWEEICRENTDIEMFHLERGLREQDVMTFKQVICDYALDTLGKDQTVMFNPMGMAAFDMAIGSYYLTRAERLRIGTTME